MTTPSYNNSDSPNKYVLNSFQTPNAVVDELLLYLTPNETVVLLYTIRHILGWTTRIAKRRHNISLDAYESGYTANENGVTYPGCGLSRDAIITALAGLVDHGVLTKGPRTIHGQVYEITFDTPALNLDKLKKRLEKRNSQNRAKLAKARKSNPRIVGKSVGQTNGNQSVGQTGNQSVGQTNGKSVGQTNSQSVPQTKDSLPDRPNRNPPNPDKPISMYRERESIESDDHAPLSQNKSKSLSEKLRAKGIGVAK